MFLSAHLYLKILIDYDLHDRFLCIEDRIIFCNLSKRNFIWFWWYPCLNCLFWHLPLFLHLAVSCPSFQYLCLLWFTFQKPCPTLCMLLLSLFFIALNELCHHQQNSALNDSLVWFYLKHRRSPEKTSKELYFRSFPTTH